MKSKKARHRNLRNKSDDINDLENEEDTNPAKSFDLFQTFISNKYFDSSLKFEKISSDVNNNNTPEEMVKSIINLEVTYIIYTVLHHPLVQ